MEAGTFTPKALFKKDIRYEIPTFQRPYVWNQEDQWEPLWDDVRNIAETYADNLEAHGGDRTLAQTVTPAHFLGAVVLQQQPNAIADLETWQVIDGQQRMTTLQIMIDAAQEVFVRLGAAPQAKKLLGLVENQLVEEEAEKWKLWPTALDRDAFFAAMTNDLSPLGFEGSAIVQAHDFFRLQMTEWLIPGGSDELDSSRAHALETTLMGLLNVVAIELAATDDSFVIFETLNARGTPLNQSDLIKNFVLQRATSAGLDSDGLHQQTWLALETPFWREEVTQGRIKRPRLDQFLNYWLAMRTRDDVTANDVFPTFKRVTDRGSDSVADIARQVRSAADKYTEFEQARAGTRTATFLYRWRTMQAGAATPLLLWLCVHEDLHSKEFEESLAILEDYLIRRMVCRGTTKDYNRLFLDAVDRLDSAPSEQPSRALRKFLEEQSSESRIWPTNGDVTAALLDLPLYRLLTRGRLRLVLEGMEDARRVDYAEAKSVDGTNLTIEHLMPQSWRAHWPAAIGDDPEETERTRERTIHTIGNLALLTGKLNTGVSNGPWKAKADKIDQQTTMLLTRDVLRQWRDQQWDDQAIRHRSGELAAYSFQTWPGPGSAKQSAQDAS